MILLRICQVTTSDFVNCQKADDMRTDEANAYTDIRVRLQHKALVLQLLQVMNLYKMQWALAGAQGEAQMMSSIGDIGSSVIGGFKSIGGGGGGTGSGYSGYSYKDFSKSMNSNPFAR